MRFEPGSIHGPVPSEGEIAELWDLCDTPGAVRDHGRAVCAKALQIAAQVEKRGIRVNVPLLRAAALLHDMCRAKTNHARAAAETLRECGYPQLADLVEKHHGGAFPAEVDEAQLLFLADKLIQGTREVSLQERFDRSFSKCHTDEARSAHAARFRMALAIQEKCRMDRILHGENGEVSAENGRIEKQQRDAHAG